MDLWASVEIFLEEFVAEHNLHIKETDLYELIYSIHFIASKGLGLEDA